MPRAGTHELRTARLLSGGNGVIAAAAALGPLAVAVRGGALTGSQIAAWVQLGLYALVMIVAVVGLVIDLHALRAFNLAIVLVFLLAVLLAWPVLALVGDGLDGALSWLLTVTAMPVVAAVIAARTRGGWIVLGLLVVGTALLRQALGDLTPNAVANDVQSAASATLLCVLAGATLSSARRADAAARAARAAGAREADAIARRAVDVRTQALVHDEVLATLGFAARPTEVMRAPLAAQAARALGLLRTLAAPETGEMTIDALGAELSTLAAAHGAAFMADTANSLVPVEVGAAVRSATQQALANRDRHAPDSRCTVSLRSDAYGVQVEIRDDGPGFDVHTAAEGRMGISVSIVERMRAVDGAASLRSAQTGTVVALTWSALPTSSGERTVDDSDAPLLRDSGMRVAGLLIALGQLSLAIWSTFWLAEPWPALLAGGALAVASLVVSWRARPPRVSTMILVAVLVLGAVATLFRTGAIVPDGAGGATYAGFWPLVGGAVVLGALCLRGRVRVALFVLTIAITIALAGAVPGPLDQAPPAMLRSVVIATGAAALAVGIRALNRRSEAARVEELRATAERAWLQGFTAQSAERLAHLEATVQPLLERIASGEELTARESRECLVLEGALRDDYRGGRLAAEPVRHAAARARRRGVDVVLIDDVPDRRLDDAQLHAVREWLVGRLDEAEESFLARILPADRSAIATASSSGTSTDFGG